MLTNPDPKMRRIETPHRQKLSSVAFLALGTLVAISCAVGVAWVVFKLVAALIRH